MSLVIRFVVFLVIIGLLALITLGPIYFIYRLIKNLMKYNHDLKNEREDKENRKP